MKKRIGDKIKIKICFEVVEKVYWKIRDNVDWYNVFDITYWKFCNKLRIFK